MAGLFIPEGTALNAWAIVVTGYGTVIEGSEELALLQAKHFEGRGHEVRIVPMGPTQTPPEAEKPKLLQWNELKPGDYWAFPFTPADAEFDANEGSQMVMISEWKGGLSIDGESESGDLDEGWGHYQFLPFVRPARGEVEFQSEDLTPKNSRFSDD